ncbi:maleylpyruvate isomerase family mycothiol-dependent enzyme [Nocardia sp. NPDC050712]|uniref:maleylpyruvate isomerase family mycothiol-dependent enzyme n=1 Tax=Nocardia sp. NPDC050712 TaxID=3155518 RepID=UPI0034082418
MTPDEYLALLRAELTAFGACAGERLDAPVEHCGDWTMYELVDHVGGGNLWVVAGVKERRGDYEPPAGPKDPAALKDWYGATANALVSVLEADPDTPAWTFWPPHTVGFWRRRRWLETLVHRFDAERALGIDSRIEAAHAADGIAEVIEVFAPRMVKRGLATTPTHSVRLSATDTGESWVLGPGDPVATISGPATQLFLALWNRAAIADLSWSGDIAAAREVMKGPLVP